MKYEQLKKIHHRSVIRQRVYDAAYVTLGVLFFLLVMGCLTLLLTGLWLDVAIALT